MKKIGTWYLVLLAVLLLFLGNAIGYLAREMATTYQTFLEGKALPPLTNIIMSIPGWPYCLAALSAVLAGLGFVRQVKSDILIQAAFWISALSGFVLLCTAFGYCMPFVPIVSKLSL